MTTETQVQSPSSVRSVTPTSISVNHTFGDIFETVRIKVKIPILLGLLPSVDNKTYLQPNVNHHHSSDGVSFSNLHDAFSKWIVDGKGIVSTEFDAILMTELKTEPSGTGNVAFNLFEVDSTNRAEEMFGLVQWNKSQTKSALQKLMAYSNEFKDIDTLQKLKLSMQKLLKTENQEDGHYFLGFTDGSHRTKSLWKLMSSLASKENFKNQIMNNDQEVFINVSFFREDFFYNDQFANWCLSALHRTKMGQKELTTHFTGREDIKKSYPGAFDNLIWYPVLFQALTVSHIKNALKHHDLNMKYGSKDNIKLPIQCAMLFSLGRLFIFSPKMTKEILPAMTYMQESSTLTPYRLGLIQSLAYDATDFLLKYFNTYFTDTAQHQTNWILRYIFRCNIEKQLLLLYKLVDTKDLDSKLTHPANKYGNDAYEDSIIHSLHCREGLTQQEEDSNEDKKNQKKKNQTKKKETEKEKTNVPVLLAPKIGSVVVADRVLFSYLRYIVFVLTIENIHVQILPIMNLLLNAELSKGDVNKEIYQRRLENNDAYLDSCMLKQEIVLGNKTLSLDPKNFIQQIFNNTDKDQTLDPIKILLDWFNTIHKDNVTIESTQLRFHRHVKGDPGIISSNFGDVVAYINRHKDRLTCSFPLRTEAAEKRKNENKNPVTPSTKRKKTEPNKQQNELELHETTTDVTQNETQEDNTQPARRSLRSRTNVSYVQPDDDESSIQEETSPLEKATIANEDKDDDEYLNTQDETATNSFDNEDQEEENGDEVDEESPTIQQEIEDLAQDNDVSVASDEAMTLFQLQLKFDDDLFFDLDEKILPYLGEQDKISPIMPRPGQNTEKAYAKMVDNMRSQLLFEVYKIYAFVLKENRCTANWNSSRAFLFTIGYAYDCLYLKPLFHRLMQFVPCFDAMFSKIQRNTTKETVLVSFNDTCISDTLHLHPKYDSKFKHFIDVTFTRNQERYRTILDQRMKLVSLFKNNNPWFPTMFQYNPTSRNENWDRHLQQANYEEYLTYEDLSHKTKDYIHIRTSMESDKILPFLSEFGFETEKFESITVDTMGKSVTDGTFHKFLVPHSASLYENLLFSSDVIAASNVLRKDDDYVRITLYDESKQEEQYFQHNELTHVLVIKLETGKTYLSPYSEDFFPVYKVRARIRPRIHQMTRCTNILGDIFDVPHTSIEVIEEDTDSTVIEFGDRNQMIPILKKRQNSNKYTYVSDDLQYLFSIGEGSFSMQFFAKDWEVTGDLFYDFDEVYTINDYYNKVMKITT
ncbi:predicted protein [Chaetoceros tenuissimus]|uniref:Uncharacterized protein n=1 Tax=Chaetoceros tenuissimus TaxID=426638 RepID=A0AAD3HE65_9STRA|nr:predicted protein [Chaetoceros tenuissimus]GFH60365.1 predicted protein [Chaetoceros tenuissimus]